VSGPEDTAGLGFAAEHARFEFDDGAYVLGALDEADRVAFEHHLQTCPLCQDSVAEMRGLPAVLEKADVTGWEPEPPPDTLLPRLLRQVSASRQRRVRRAVLGGLVAACLAAALLVGGFSLWHSSHQPQAFAMQSLGPNPGDVYATISLTGSGANTRIELHCGYHADATASYPAGQTAPSYRMVVFNLHGQMRDLGSWTSEPGNDDIVIARNSPWSRQNISKIEVSTTNGGPILRLTL
jgi:hypothetical protein